MAAYLTKKFYTDLAGHLSTASGHEVTLEHVRAAMASTLEPAARRGKRGGAKGEKRAPTTSAYILFCNDKRPEVVAANPEAKFPDVGRMLGAAWKARSDEENEKYQARAQELRAAAEAAKSAPAPVVEAEVPAAAPVTKKGKKAAAAPAAAPAAAAPAAKKAATKPTGRGKKAAAVQ
jgi:hypothetical protein